MTWRVHFPLLVLAGWTVTYRDFSTKNAALDYAAAKERLGASWTRIEVVA